MEGVSMYLSPKERAALFERLGGRFDRVLLLMDCYTEWAARLSKRRNPVHGLGVGEVFGVDDPRSLEKGGIVFSEEKSMTPPKYVAELRGMERHVFRRLYAGKISRQLYRLFEYRKDGAV
jgi:O-methyltransferase involved in polyketide biosynthesis